MVCPISFEGLSNLTAEDTESAEGKKKRGELRSLSTHHILWDKVLVMLFIYSNWLERRSVLLRLPTIAKKQTAVYKLNA